MRRFWQSAFFSAEGGAGGGAGGAGEKPVAPAGFESFWDGEKNTLKLDELGGVLKEHGELKTFKTEHDTRLAALPQKPEDVKLVLPEGFKLPEGATFQLDEKDPLVGEFRTLAVAEKLPPAVTSKLVGLLAQRDLATQAKQLEDGKAWFDAETKVLGQNAGERRQAVIDYFKANAGDGVASSIQVAVVEATMVTALENLIKAANGGVIPSSGSNTGKQEKSAAQVLFGDMGFN